MPLRLFFACLFQRHLLPQRSFRYVDFGCGQGLNLACAAALHPDSQFVGVDFMPEHVLHGRRLAAELGLTNVIFVEGDFVELARDPSPLGGVFDIAVAHGISTWITEPAYQALFTLVGATLNPGGIFYNSYNTHPGWLSAVPFQHVILAENRRNPGRPAITHAISVFEKLKEANAAVVSSIAGLMSRVEKAKELDPSYLTQEYNNEGWEPRWVDDSIALLAQSKLSYLGSATLTEATDANLPQKMRELIAAQPTVAQRELMRDLCFNQAFRRDLYVKGADAPTQLQYTRHMLNLRYVANMFKPLPPEGEPFVFLTGAVELKGNFTPYSQLLSCLIDSPGASVGELSKKLNRRAEELVQMLTLLVHSGWAYLARKPDSKEVESCARANSAFSRLAAEGAPYRYLLSSVATQAMAVGEIDMILFSLCEQKTPAKNLAQKALETLGALGKSLMREGKPIVEHQEALSEMQTHVDRFNMQLPKWKALGISPTV